jgi:hypothetical protein
VHCRCTGTQHSLRMKDTRIHKLVWTHSHRPRKNGQTNKLQWSWNKHRMAYILFLIPSHHLTTLHQVQLNLFNTALEYVTRQLSVPVHSTICYKSVNTTNRKCRWHKYHGKNEKCYFWGIRRTKREQKKQGQHQCRKNKRNGGKQENMVKKEISTENDHNTKVARSFKYLGTVINNDDDEKDEIKAGIIAAY